MVKTAALIATAAALSIAALVVGAATPPSAAVARTDDPPAVPVPPARPVTPVTVTSTPVTPTVRPAVKPVSDPVLPPKPHKLRRPHIDMVFALDTTGSMGGLLEGAKQKIWHIVSSVAQGQPTPIVRVGLVAYRDKGDAYVTKVTPLSRHIDSVYASLMKLNAGGGGDTPEDVDQALYDAVHKIQWSGPQSNTLRVLFLVGDAPPHTDYRDVPSYQHTLREAARQGIVVNAIRCGDYAATGVVWNRIARLGHGKYLSIDEDGGMVATATPYDGRLAALSDALDATYVPVGSVARRHEAHRALHDYGHLAGRAGASVAADRATFRAGVGDTAAAPAEAAKADVVTAYDKNKKAAERTLTRTADLPASLAKMPLAARKAYVQKQAKKRQTVRLKIDALAKQRRAWLAHHATGGKGGFDAQVVKVVRQQAAEKAHVKY